MPNTLVLHPTNGTYYFGMIPEKRIRGILIPGAPIVLKRGKHSGRGGFGVAHIWARHERELRLKGHDGIDDVPRYVADIVRPGSAVFCEFERIRDMRVTVVRTSTGVAVLEHKDMGEDPHYSVVTAFAQRNAHGTRIGSVSEYLSEFRQ